MSKIINLEFTDAQWKLIEDNYVTHDTAGSTVDCTEETFAYTMKVSISRKVTSIMANKAAEINKDAFNV